MKRVKKLFEEAGATFCRTNLPEYLPLTNEGDISDCLISVAATISEQVRSP